MTIGIAGPPRTVAAGGDRIVVSCDRPVDLRSTVGVNRVGGRDRVVALEATGVWRATRTPDGPATVHVAHDDGTPLSTVGTTEVRVTAWGPGAAWCLRRAADLVGAGDAEAFDPAPGLVRDLHRRRPALRFGCNRSVVETLIPTILEQKVTTIEAHRSYHGLLRAFGDTAPGPAGARGLRLGPDPARLAELPYHRFHGFGIERRRAETILRVCRRADRLDAFGHGDPLAPPPAADERARLAGALASIPGIGPWTTAIVAQSVLGDPDAVIVGDYHLPNLVAWNLAGEARADDARMLELLEPYAGHRGRVVRLLGGGGNHAPKFGPKARLRDFSRY